MRLAASWAEAALQCTTTEKIRLINTKRRVFIGTRVLPIRAEGDGLIVNEHYRMREGLFQTAQCRASNGASPCQHAIIECGAFLEDGRGPAAFRRQ
jgi:hypothetical protein